MNRLNRKTKKELLRFLIEDKSVFSLETYEDSVYLFEICLELWDLDNLPSEDERYNNASKDIYQHIVNNHDYTILELFEERLNILEDNDKFISLLELIIHPNVRTNVDSIEEHRTLIDEYLNRNQLTFVLDNYDEDGLPIYRITDLELENKHPKDLVPNRIPFFVDKQPTGTYYFPEYHKRPNVFPSFVLAFCDYWNDYDYQTLFALFYYPEDDAPVYLKTVKIMEEESENTASVIPESFDTLPDNFCSLSDSRSYYLDIREHLGENYLSVLYALKDCAFFPSVHELFEQNSIFRYSIIRRDKAERSLRTSRFIGQGYDFENLYSFSYQFRPTFSEFDIEVDFPFSQTDESPDRIFGVIGKNGCGKTQLITSLPKAISEKKGYLFTPNIPIFSKVISVSYSYFDSFEIPKNTSSFNYVYCGIRNQDGGVMDEKQLRLRFHRAWKKIRKHERLEKWRDILLTFIEEEILDQFILKSENSDDEISYEVSVNGFNSVRKKLSSGQSIILFIMTEIVANIRLDSLIIYDEPETHLHPNAITQLMNTIYELVEKFESYCIIATHSPLIIREMLSRNVYVMEKHESIPSIRKLPIETFGENLSILTEEVFENKNIEKKHKSIIRDMVNHHLSYDEIINKIETENASIGLNMKLYIKSVLNEKS